MDTIEEVIEIVKEKGLLVNNWFQHDDGTWQFNVRKVRKDTTDRYEFGKGSTPVLAARECLGKLKIQNHNSTKDKKPKRGIIIKKKNKCS